MLLGAFARAAGFLLGSVRNPPVTGQWYAPQPEKRPCFSRTDDPACISRNYRQDGSG